MEKEKKNGVSVNFRGQNYIPSKTSKTKENGSPWDNKLNHESMKSLRLNASQEAKLKNNTLRKVIDNLKSQMNEEDLEKKVYNYLDFLEVTPVQDKVFSKCSKKEKKSKATHQSTRSKESDAECLLERHEHIREGLTKVKDSIKSVIDGFKKEKEENWKLKKFINLIIKEHEQLCTQEGHEKD